MGNWVKTSLLLGALTALIIGLGYLFGGRQGMVFAFVIALAMNFFSYWYSDKIVLKMYRAKEVGPGDRPDLYQIVQEIAQKADLPMPRVYIIPQDSPNAFATGRNPQHAVVAVTEGLLKLMNREEIQGVLAHEMAHVRNRDVLISTVAATIAGAIMILATMARWTAFLGGGSDDDEGGLGTVGLIVMSILAPIAAMVIQMAISRAGEYRADATGAGFAGRSEGLASALEKLGQYSKRVPLQANPSTAHMFIVNPLTSRNLMQLFSTHPPLEERIARLRGSKTPPPSSPEESDDGIRSAEATWQHLSR